MPVPGRPGFIRSNFELHIPRRSGTSNCGAKKKGHEEQSRTISKTPSPALSVSGDLAVDCVEDSEEGEDTADEEGDGEAGDDEEELYFVEKILSHGFNEDVHLTDKLKLK